MLDYKFPKNQQILKTVITDKEQLIMGLRLKKGIKIGLIIDNAPALTGVLFFNHTIHSPEIIKDLKNKICVDMIYDKMYL